jgi:hypothetical protein
MNIASHSSYLAKQSRTQPVNQLTCNFEAESGHAGKVEDGERTGEVDGFECEILEDTLAHIEFRERLRPMRGPCGGL